MLSFLLRICHWGLSLGFCNTLILCGSFFPLAVTTLTQPPVWKLSRNSYASYLLAQKSLQVVFKDCCCMFCKCVLQYLTSITLFQVRTRSPGIGASNGERDLIAIGTSPLAHDLLCLHCIWLLPYGQFLPLFIQFHNSFSDHNFILLHILFCSFIKVCEV